MNKIFQIGHFCFQLFFPKEITLPCHFMKFESDTKDVDYSYYVKITDQFPLPKGNLVASRDDLLVYQKDDLETRYIGVKGIEGYYACYQEIDSRQAHVYLRSNRLNGLNIDPIFASLLALERKVIQHNEIILHCAYMQYQNQAILFSAPSETGKTTQANLWRKYKHSQTINGDRSLLTYQNHQWIAQGWPVCGSSKICHNISMPIHAIVMLSQDQTNHIEKLSSAKAFQLIYSQITINRWNQKDHLHVIDLIEHLVNHVPIYHLGCTISKEAVDCLYHEVYEKII